MPINENPRLDPAAESYERGGGRGRPEHLHARQLEQFSESLAKDGELAIQRWGFAFFHSLSDEEVQDQRQKLGFPTRDALDYYNQGCLAASQGEFGPAVKAFDHALKLKPELSEAAYNKAYALEQSGNAHAARDAWKAYVENFPENEDVVDVKQHLTNSAA